MRPGRSSTTRRSPSHGPRRGNFGASNDLEMMEVDAVEHRAPPEFFFVQLFEQWPGQREKALLPFAYEFASEGFQMLVTLYHGGHGRPLPLSSQLAVSPARGRF